VTQELALAHAFLLSLSDPRASWATLFDIFAREKQLSPDLARSTRICVLKLRVFGAIERTARRRP